MDPKTPPMEYNNPEFEREVPHYLDRVWTAKEVAELFGLDTSTVRRACERGQVLARKAGGTWLISSYDALTRWKDGIYD